MGCTGSKKDRKPTARPNNDSSPPSSEAPSKSKVKLIENADDFISLLNSAGKKLVMVDFYATWCRPCKEVAPKIEAMVDDYPEVVFCKVDVDECEEIARDYGINAMPTFHFMKYGMKIDEITGGNEQMLRTYINNYK